MTNDLWTIHMGREIRNKSSDEFIGYVSVTGDHVIEGSNIEKSNYFDPRYESKFTTNSRQHIMVLPIWDFNEVIVGVLEIVNYQTHSSQYELEEKYLADYMTYSLGIAIYNQHTLETEMREQTTMKQIFDAFTIIVDLYNIQDLASFA